MRTTSKDNADWIRKQVKQEPKLRAKPQQPLAEIKAASTRKRSPEPIPASIHA